MRLRPFILASDTRPVYFHWTYGHRMSVFARVCVSVCTHVRVLGRVFSHLDIHTQTDTRAVLQPTVCVSRVLPFIVPRAPGRA